MALPLYLAQTPKEMAGNPLPRGMAYMACHFSPGGTGLSNLPEVLPAGAMLILDDSAPMDGHDPERILEQLSPRISELGCESLLLDFQRQNIPGQQKLAQLLTASLPCPVGVSELYADRVSCPVFLPPCPPDRPLPEYLAPWQHREIWLEAALDGITLTLTESGCSVEALYDFPDGGMRDDQISCHYAVETTADSAIFQLWRTRHDLDTILAAAETQGVTKAIGLWQELGK